MALTSMPRATQSKFKGTSSDLHSALSKAFSDSFHFKGRSHHFIQVDTTPANAPSPRLSVAGVVGTLALPLSERDAKRVLLSASHAGASPPAGKPASILVSASAVSISNNAQWTKYAEEVATQTMVPVMLGVPAAGVPKLRLELIRLCIHPPGASTPPHTEILDNPKAYAIITFVLPSHYQGGQFNIANGKDSAPTVYETPNNSTSVLACWSHVGTTVQPVVSGYRLSLTYAVIHACPTTPLPCMPTLHKNIDTTFRAVFQKWKDNTYTAVPKIPLVACVLRGEGSDAAMGVKGLNKRDAAIVNLLHATAKSVGISVFTANLTKKVEGVPRKDDFTYACMPSYRRGGSGYGYGYDSEDEDGYGGPDAEDYDSYFHGDYDTPEMGKIESEEHTLSFLKSVEPGAPLLSSMGEFKIEEQNLVAQDDEFDELDEDDADFDRDTGTVTHLYHRCVIVFSRPEDETNMVLALKGPYWCLQRLKVTSKPTTRAAAIVSAAAKKLAEKRDESWAFLHGSDVRDAAKSILAHATAWKRHDLWNTAIAHCQGLSVQETSTAIGAALKVFEVALLKDGLISLVKRTTALNRRFELVKAISANDSLGTDLTWLEELMQEALATCTKPTVEDIPALVSIAQSRGPASILSLIAKVDQTGTYAVLMALAKALHELSQNPATPVSSKDSLTEAVRRCVSAAAPQWESNLYVQRWKSEVDTNANDKTKRICEIVVFCHTINYLQPCFDLLNSLCNIKPDADAAHRLKEVHAPLCFHLQATLKTLGKPVYSEPFASFYRNSISLYLTRVLGAKPALPVLPSKPIGCGCADCIQLDKFLRGTEAVTSYKASQPRRTHVEAQIRKEHAILDRLVTTDTEKYGSPHTLYVRRRPAVMAALKWDEQKAAASAFVKCVCADDRGLRQLMDARYDDIMDAIHGTKAFVAGDPNSDSQVKTKRSATSNACTTDLKRQRV